MNTNFDDKTPLDFDFLESIGFEETLRKNLCGAHREIGLLSWDDVDGFTYEYELPYPSQPKWRKIVLKTRGDLHLLAAGLQVTLREEIYDRGEFTSPITHDWSAFYGAPRD